MGFLELAISLQFFMVHTSPPSGVQTQSLQSSFQCDPGTHLSPFKTGATENAIVLHNHASNFRFIYLFFSPQTNKKVATKKRINIARLKLR
jgi:hypothetical protein